MCFGGNERPALVRETHRKLYEQLNGPPKRHRGPKIVGPTGPQLAPYPNGDGSDPDTPILPPAPDPFGILGPRIRVEDVIDVGAGRRGRSTRVSDLKIGG
jgi:hypothetical protein